MVFKNNYLTQLQIKWSLDQTRDIAQCKTITKNVNFNSKQCPKTNLEYNLYCSNSQPARHLTQYKHLFQGNQRITEVHNSLYFNFHLAECKYYWPELVIMNVSRNSWSLTKVRFTINLLLSVNDSGCQKKTMQWTTGLSSIITFFHSFSLKSTQVDISWYVQWPGVEHDWHHKLPILKCTC